MQHTLHDDNNNRTPEKKELGEEVGGGNKRKPSWAGRVFKATPVLKKAAANFNSPVERVSGTYRRQPGCGPSTSAGRWRPGGSAGRGAGQGGPGQGMQPPAGATRPGQWFCAAGLALPPKTRISPPKKCFSPPFSPRRQDARGFWHPERRRSAPPELKGDLRLRGWRHRPANSTSPAGREGHPGGLWRDPTAFPAPPCPVPSAPGEGPLVATARWDPSGRKPRRLPKTKPPKFIKRTPHDARAGPGNLRSLPRQREISLSLQNPIEREREAGWHGPCSSCTRYRARDFLSGDTTVFRTRRSRFL